MHADIFCRVIDNFGDIGVTWRLARQLQQEHEGVIRLWVDDLDSFKRIEPWVQSLQAEQRIAKIDVIHWTDPPPDLSPLRIVIASFSCELPASFVARMAANKCLWINLEYLSAESWVETHHGLPSLRTDGTSSHFFFPGFTPKTGGLLREATLLSDRDHWRSQPAEQYRFLRDLGVPKHALDSGHPRLISLFCYPQAPIQSLLDVLTADARSSILLIPDGVAPAVDAGQYGNMHVVRIPFVSQPDYDRILWLADLNFVRGEDSIVRGLWAGKPLVWHIYPQTEGTHLTKLQAWLALNPLSAAIETLQRDWNRDAPPEEISASLRTAFEPARMLDWQQEAEQICQNLSQYPDLASTLSKFCLQKLDI